MTTALNSPVEAAVRALVLLVQAFPSGVDMNRLVLLDHALLNSADFDGPRSLHPPLPIRSGQLALKRNLLQSGLKVLLRARLIDASPTKEGIFFRADEGAQGFLALFQSEYVSRLASRASWAFSEFGDLSEEELRLSLRVATHHWTEEFEYVSTSSGRESRT